MSARRLSIIQPSSFELSDSANKEINKWIKKYPKDRMRSALIPALWIIQKDAGGWLPELALRAIGDMLDMAYEPNKLSRLSCQVLVSDELDGLTVNIPSKQG